MATSIVTSIAYPPARTATLGHTAVWGACQFQYKAQPVNAFQIMTTGGRSDRREKQDSSGEVIIICLKKNVEEEALG